MRFQHFFSLGVLLLLLSSCAEWESAKLKLSGENSSLQKSVCAPAPACPVPPFVNPDSVAYFFDDGNEALKKFIQSTDDELFCVFSSLENEEIAEEIINLQDNDAQVELLFNTAGSFKNCEDACIPREGSQYSELLRSAVPVQMTDSNERFCVNEKGILFYSGNVDNVRGVQESHIVFSKELSQKYRSHFKRMKQ